MGKGVEERALHGHAEIEDLEVNQGDSGFEISGDGEFAQAIGTSISDVNDLDEARHAVDEAIQECGFYVFDTETEEIHANAIRGS